MLSKLKFFQQKIFFVLVLCLIFYALSLFALPNDLSIAGLELAIFMAIYKLPEFLTPIFLIITQLGSMWSIIGLVIGVSFKNHYHLALRLVLATSVAAIATELIKNNIMRSRPYNIIEFVNIRDFPTLGYSFPSGHSAVIAAAVLILYLNVSKKYRPWLVVALVLVGLSRVYLGVHAPLDVLAGFSLGGFAAATVIIMQGVIFKLSTK